MDLLVELAFIDLMAGEKAFLSQIGAAVRAARIRLAWSQERLADECGLDRTYIGGVERGERNLTVLKLKQIADHLGLKPADLVNDFRD